MSTGQIVVGKLLSAVAAVASMTEERRRGALPLLLQTTFAPWRIVGGKIDAAGSALAPVVVFGVVVIVWGLEGSSGSLCGGGGSSLDGGDPVIGAGQRWLELGWGLLWLFGHGCLFLLTSLALALRTPALQLVWGFSLVLGLAWLVLPLGFAQALGTGEALQLGGAFVPDQHYDPSCGLVPISVGRRVMVWGLAAVMFFGVAARLREWGTK